MKLIDLLSQILKAHALSLKALRNQLGHPVLLERIALLNLHLDPKHPSFNLYGALSELRESSSLDPRDPYAIIEETVAQFCPHPHLEIHLWGYPLYRSLIESDLNLGMPIPDSHRPGINQQIQSGARFWLQSFFGEKEILPASWAPWT